VQAGKAFFLMHIQLLPDPVTWRRHLLVAGITALVGALTLGLFADPAQAGKRQNKGVTVKVMLRNLYLGANDTEAIAAASFSEFLNETGEILNTVDTTNFPTRSKALAAEILNKKPDLVGLNEAALWRVEPADGQFIPPEATAVRYDFLQILLDRLNEGKRRYRVVAVQEEFDFEVPADTVETGDDEVEVDGRLTHRDVILARRNAGVKTSKARSGNFDNLLQLNVQGLPVEVARGWNQVNATVRGSKPFRFVNTHLEVRQPELEVPSLPAKQAGELIAPGGPAGGKLPVVLVGDLNSSLPNPMEPERDVQAYQLLLDAGFRNRDAGKPTHGANELLTTAVFDERIDHVMTDTPEKIKKIRASRTGLDRVDGLYPSDHVGLFSALRVPRR
jgi:endonuclease/exonuclease/phosphatase family metal-dependent hydrolase